MSHVNDITPPAASIFGDSPRRPMPNRRLLVGLTQAQLIDLVLDKDEDIEALRFTLSRCLVALNAYDAFERRR